MKVSIITVCFNSADTIEDTIKSVLSQDYKDIEYIVVDGGSMDGTLGVMSKYNDRITKVISEPDEGIYDAMNKGIKAAKGDIIAFLNADDFYSNGKVVTEIANFIKTSSLDATYGDLVYVNKKSPEKIVRYWRTGEYTNNAFMKGWVIPHPTFFCKKEIFKKYGGFNVDFKIAADFELFIRFIERYNIKTGYLPKVIVKMRSGGKANRLKGIIRGNIEIMKSFRLNNIRLSPFFFLMKLCTKVRQFVARPK